MSTLDVLRTARNLISSPFAWTQGVYACDEEGYAVDPIDGAACKFCAIGAISSVDDDPGALARAEMLLRRQTQKLYGQSIVDCNDRCGHAAILSAFDAAIAAAEAEAR